MADFYDVESDQENDLTLVLNLPAAGNLLVTCGGKWVCVAPWLVPQL